MIVINDIVNVVDPESNQIVEPDTPLNIKTEDVYNVVTVTTDRNGDIEIVN